jgi:hypothetical protein
MSDATRELPLQIKTELLRLIEPVASYIAAVGQSTEIVSAVSNLLSQKLTSIDIAASDYMSKIGPDTL